MKKVYYHATPYENLPSILDKGILTGYDGVVYLCEQPYEAARFVAIRGCTKILVIGVEIEESMIRESNDHNFLFFKCLAYTYSENISINDCVSFSKYEI